MTILAQLHERHALSALDVQLARTLARLGGEQREEVLLAVALLSRHIDAGNVCMDLDDPALVDPTGAPLDLGELPSRWRASLPSSALVGDPDAPGPTAPLVLHGTRLYLRRQWEDECALAANLRARAQASPGLDCARLRSTLDRLRPATPGAEPDWQRVAACIALRRRLCVITGGPGTGKTTTVATIAALAIDQALARSQRAPRIVLCAPTGKAAGRLAETLRDASGTLRAPDGIRAAMPTTAVTVHRLLGASTTRPGRFRHDAHRPVHLDLLIVDEASMVDLDLMTRLVAAVPSTATLILLGDRHQLASVEAGAVLGDLCAAVDGADYSGACAADVRAATGDVVPTAPETTSPIRDCIVTLTRSHRFDAASDVGRLATAIRAGRVRDVEALLASDAHANVRRFDAPPADPDRPTPAPIRDAIATGYAPYLRARESSPRLAALAGFRILCAHHQGPDGVDAMNRTAERVLTAAGLLRVDGPYYDARPILVTRNDYRVGLFNGDVGTIVAGTGDGGTRLALFPAPDGRERWLSPGRLPPSETAFAISIHKSQGSEVDHALIVLPTRPSPVLSRELLYTAVSRARISVTICAPRDVLNAAIETPVRRSSGLRDRLQR